jgi:hypothetical protein
MPDDYLIPVTFSMIVVFAGLLAYYRPPDMQSRLFRRAIFAAMVCSVALLTVHTEIEEMKTGGFFALVVAHHQLMIPHPYDYYLFYRTLPIIKTFCISVALVCPAIYLACLRKKGHKTHGASGN